MHQQYYETDGLVATTKIRWVIRGDSRVLQQAFTKIVSGWHDPESLETVWVDVPFENELKE